MEQRGFVPTELLVGAFIVATNISSRAGLNAEIRMRVFSTKIFSNPLIKRDETNGA